MASRDFEQELFSIAVGKSVLEPVGQEDFNLHKEHIYNPDVDFFIGRSTLLLKNFTESFYPDKKISFIREDRVTKKDEFSLKVCLLACSDEEADLDETLLNKFKDLLIEFSCKASGHDKTLLISAQAMQLSPEERELAQQHVDQLSESAGGKKISRPFTIDLDSSDGSISEIPFSREFKQPVIEGGEESEPEVIFAYADGSQGSNDTVFLKAICEETYEASAASQAYKVDQLNLTKQASLLYANSDYPLVKARVYRKKAKSKKPELRIISIEPATLEEMAEIYPQAGALTL